MVEEWASNAEIEFASLLEYSPRGRSPCSVLSRRFVRDDVKNVEPAFLQDLAWLLKHEKFHEVYQFFGESTVLIPVPRSRPHYEAALWPALEICHSLLEADLASCVWPGLRRTKSVQQSCAAIRGERPDPDEHLDSLSVLGALPGGSRLLLIDDFVTRGSTLIASAAALREKFPKADVKAFALVNTMRPNEEAQNHLRPQSGTIRYFGGELKRESWVDRIREQQAGGLQATR